MQRYTRDSESLGQYAARDDSTSLRQYRAAEDVDDDTDSEDRLKGVNLDDLIDSLRSEPLRRAKKKRRMEPGPRRNRFMDGGGSGSEESDSPPDNNNEEPAQYYSNAALQSGRDEVQGDPIPPAPEWKFVPPAEIVFPEFDPSGVEIDKTYCFACDHSQNSKEMMSNPRFLRLKATYDTHYGLLHPIRLATMIQEEYVKHLMKRTLLKKMWGVEAIHAHFTEHAPSVIVMMEDSLRVINSAMQSLKTEGMFKQEVSSKKRAVDSGGAKLYLSLFDKRKQLIQDIQGKRSGNIL
jgi:hypothetical protein